MSDRTQSAHAQQQAQRERTAVAIANERLPWMPAIQERFGITRSEWRALVESVFPSARTVEGVILALSYCKARKLDVFKRPVHIVPIWNSELRREVETVWPGIGELLTTAMRTGEFGGFDECKFGPDVTRSFSGTTGRRDEAREVTVELTFPEWAQVTCYRFMGSHGDKVVIAGPRVYWMETYATQGRGSVPNAMWQKRPRGQLEKCATAAALRRGFPEEVGSDATVDEVGGSSEGVTIQGEMEEIVTASENIAPRAEPRKEPSRRREPRQQETREETREEPPQQTERTHHEAPRETVVPASEARTPPPPVDGPPTAAGGDAFQAFLVDTGAIETTDEPFLDPVTFARAVADLCRDRPDDEVAIILELNEGALADAAEASDEARRLIDILRGSESVAEEAAPTALRPVHTRENSRGATNWQRYAEDCKADLETCGTSSDIDAWVLRNQPTYVGRAIEGAIISHLRARRAAIGEPANLDESEARAAEAAKDAREVAALIAPLGQYHDPKLIDIYRGGTVVTTKLDRFQREGKQALAQRVLDAFEARKAELRMGAG